MGEFTGFDEAARLYAQYWAVVDSMYKAFEQNVDGFLDAIRDQIGQLIAPAHLQERQTPGYRYWGIAKDDMDKDAYPQLWLSTREAKIVLPGELRMTAVAPRAEAQELRRLADVATQHNLSSYCKSAGGGRWSLFYVLVSYPQQDPATHAAKPIADVLLALHNAYANK
jgi:hypothetical protein